MYKEFFGLKAAPFNTNPDPRFLFVTQHTREALACLSYGVKVRKGFILLTGEVGTGKTTLLNFLLGWLRQQRISTAFVFNPRLSVMEFFDFVTADFGLACDSQHKGKMLSQLNHWLLERYRAGEGAALIIDEAHDLSTEMLEEVRLLTNLETATAKLLQIVLSGQPELEEKLKKPELRQLRQRITLRCRTYPLTRDETASYITRRLQIAGNREAVFEPAAVDAICGFSLGIPRVINLLCEHALINAFVDQCKVVRRELIEEVAREFELHEIAPVVQATAGENLGMLQAMRAVARAQGAQRAGGPNLLHDKEANQA